MKKIIQFLKNEFPFKKSGGSENNEEITIPVRHMSILCALLLLLLFFTFMAGYFLGKKNAAEQFLYKVEQESLADQIYSSMCGLADDKDEGETSDDTESKDEPDEEEEGVPSTTIQEASLTPAESKPHYYAQLAGFGSRSSAQQLERRLKEQGIEVEIVEKESSSTRGKKVTWYQVVTKKFEQKSELITLVNKIKKREHLGDVHIATA